MASMDTRKITDLPTELLLEILSFHTYSFDFHCPLLRQEGPLQRQSPRQNLRSFSQTCSTLRAVSLPLLWERADLCNAITQPASELEYVLPLIKSVHVWGKSHYLQPATLVALLKTLPNCTGLQLILNDHAKEDFIPILASASLPNITELWIRDSWHGIMYAFPSLTTLASPSMFANSTVLESAKVLFPRLEALIGVRFSKGDDHDTLAQDFPHLRVLAIASSPSSTGVPPSLRGFKNLTELSLLDGPAFPVEALIAGGRQVLSASQVPGSKVLRVWQDGQAGPRLIHSERC
ncbi:hypothetical protein C8R46DRAFT_437748 [Mycena filopes]|nr:hypothetical protein C8R46DRAFT_437748 [Mycena filopes]